MKLNVYTLLAVALLAFGASGFMQAIDEEDWEVIKTHKPDVQDDAYEILGVKRGASAYEILGVKPTATKAEIKKAYDRKFWLYDPKHTSLELAKPAFELIKWAGAELGVH